VRQSKAPNASGGSAAAAPSSLSDEDEDEAQSADDGPVASIARDESGIEPGRIDVLTAVSGLSFGATSVIGSARGADSSASAR
jgi:hypothetical protein